MWPIRAEYYVDIERCGIMILKVNVISLLQQITLTEEVILKSTVKDSE